MSHFTHGEVSCGRLQGTHKDKISRQCSYQGRRGHPPLLSSLLLPDLRALSQAQSLREVLARHSAGTLEVPVDTPEVLIDVNTPEDYHQALSYFHGL